MRRFQQLLPFPLLLGPVASLLLHIIEGLGEKKKFHNAKRLYLNLEEEGCMFLRNVATRIQVHTAS
jgi:hypothetical protein